MSEKMYNQTPAEILAMRPATLRFALTRRLAADTTLATRISELTGFEPRWYRLGTVELAIVAMAWAYLSDGDAFAKLQVYDAMNNLKAAMIATSYQKES
jgi:hypothetical protein